MVQIIGMRLSGHRDENSLRVWLVIDPAAISAQRWVGKFLMGLSNWLEFYRNWLKVASTELLRAKIPQLVI
jgi:hypothetical protein